MKFQLDFFQRKIDLNVTDKYSILRMKKSMTGGEILTREKFKLLVGSVIGGYVQPRDDFCNFKASS